MTTSRPTGTRFLRLALPDPPPAVASTLSLLLAGTLAIAAMAQASEDAGESPTFTRDIAPILQNNCQVCHRPAGVNLMGMVAPMSLITYEEVRPWAKAMARQVEARTMPPWHASPDFDGVFANQRTLTDAEIDTIVLWARTGAPRGRPEDTPEPPMFSANDGWSIGKPDLVVAFDEPYFVDDDVEDHYETIFVRLDEDDLPEDRWIQAMEFRPGSDVVHHIVIFTSGQRESLGFATGMLGGMGSGTDPSVFPEGYGRLLSKGSTVMFNMHYHKEPGPGTGVFDRSQIAFKFQKGPVAHNVRWGAIGTMIFEIPPHHDNFPVTASEVLDKDTTLLALFPHTHLRGKASRFVAFYPDGTEEVLLDVPVYDFDWQTNYVYKQPKQLPAGTRIEVTMWYDNSSARAERAGIDPSRTVRWGQPTTDEMMYGWIDYTEAEPIPVAKGLDADGE